MNVSYRFKTTRRDFRFEIEQAHEDITIQYYYIDWIYTDETVFNTRCSAVYSTAVSDRAR